jgi:hypothetical protein
MGKRERGGTEGDTLKVAVIVDRSSSVCLVKPKSPRDTTSRLPRLAERERS